MASESAAQTDGNKKKLIRKPNDFLWTGTSLVIIYAVWCILLLILTASGHLLNSHSFGCINTEEDFVTSRLKEEAELVYLWAGLSLLVCILLLLEFWRRNGYYVTAFLVATCVLFVIMCVTLYYFVENESKEIQKFEQCHEYLNLQTLKHRPENIPNHLTDAACHILDVHRWQAEFKCCGLRGYRDWGFSIPDSCLCDGDGNSVGCVGVGRSLVYEKPCLPTVLSLVGKRSSTFWAVMITWIILTVAPVAFLMLYPVVYGLGICCYFLVCEECCYKLHFWIYKMRGGEEMVPVVFIRKNNNNQTEEAAKESSCDDRVVLDVEGSANVEGEGQEAGEEDFNDNPVRMIPLSELRRLQEELDPPPTQHQVRCLCIIACKLRNFYTILLEDGSPLLPSNAVLVDANKPTSECLWAEGHHVFCVEGIVWPKERNAVSSPLLL